MRNVCLAACLALASLSVFGQSDRGSITGTVTDPSGAVLASAPVEAKSTTTGLLYPTVTSGTGNYTIAGLPVGTYDISVTSTGFKRAVRTTVEVTTSTTFRVDFKLEVGAATESVTITEEAPLLKTESGELSHNVSVSRLNDLPILTLGSGGVAGARNPLAALSLIPGAQFSSDSTLRINGMPSSTQSIRIEGQDATNGFWKQQNTGNQTGVDAIEEVAIQTSNFAAEFGQAGGGYINYTMKSGTNQYHGSAFDYTANEAFNAGTPFTDAGLTNSQRAGQLVRNSLRRYDFGGTFGGPVRIPKLYNGHDRTFFFFSYEQYIQKSFTSNGLANVPTTAYQQGDFSKALNPALTIGGAAQTDALGTALLGNQIFDPLTQRVVNGQNVRLPFANNTIPLTRLDATALKVQSLIPQPTDPNNLINNYAIPGYYNFTHTEIPTLKLDHNVSPSIKVSMFYSANRIYSPSANGYTQAFSSAEPTNSLSQTTRLNYDQTITPTLLMHVGAGLLQTTLYTVPSSPYDQSQLFGTNTFYTSYFPNISPGNDLSKGGTNVPLGVGFLALFQKDTKPTFNNSFTWVKGNHTLKFGGEAIFEGLPIANGSRSNGVIGFGQQETADPYATGLTFQNGATGFAYASFLLGAYNSLNVSPQDTLRLGNHTFGLYAQDTWKVSRRLTVDFGLRYDYATLLAEQHGRMQDAAFQTPNAAIGGRIGGVVYGGNCNCQLNGNYPWALGPRLGIAYKINEKTVLRLGSGVSYGTSPNNSFLSYSVPDFYSYSDQPVGGVPAGLLKDGNPFAPGNRFGNAPLVWPDFSAHYPFQTAPGYAPPQSPFISIDRNAGRLPRILQWSIGAQREVFRGLVVDAAWVGNRGVWWTAPLLDTPNYNALTPATITASGLNLNNPNDLALLTTPISSPLVQARFPNLKVVTLPNGLQVVPSVYPGFPATQTLNQALRPYPQWGGVPPFLGPPLGDTWYDSLQLKVTKRYSHGLDFLYSFAWQKEQVLGASNDTSYLVSGYPRINDVFNYAQNKQLNPFSRPLVSIISLNYHTPGIPGDSKGMKVVSHVVKDWVFGAVLRYQSGQLIPTPASNNNFLNQMARGASNNPANWGGGSTYQNLVSGQPFFLVDPNCHCFDPTKQLVLNKDAWSDPAAGQYGSAAPFYNNFRWQRQPAEAMSFGRQFALAKEGKINLYVRAEFQNIFNRTFYASPSTNGFLATGLNPTASVLFANKFANGLPGALSSGYGYVNSVNGGPLGVAQPRSGQFVARLTF